MMKNSSAAAIGFIGYPDEKALKIIEEETGKPVRISEKNGKMKLVIGTGLLKKQFASIKDKRNCINTKNRRKPAWFRFTAVFYFTIQFFILFQQS